MEVIVRPTAKSAEELTAKIIAAELIKKPNMTLGLATGRTMERLYDLLGQKCKNEGLDFSLCKTFNLDEYVGLAPEDPNSYRYYMNKNLFEEINIDMRNTHVENGIAEDLDEECARYEEMIEEAGGLDLQLLGIGRSGHIGFNEPLSPLTSRTRMVPLTKVTYEQNSPLFENPEDMPMLAMTMGVGTILEAKKLVMLVTGAEKADIIAKAIEGPVTSMISGSAIQFHPDCVVILDEEAAAKLEGKEDYAFAVKNSPKYKDFL